MLPHLVSLVERLGHDASGIRRLPGLEHLVDPDLRVPEATAQEAWRLAAAITRDPALGIHLAESLPRGALDLVEYAFRSSASLAIGLGRLARYGRVVSDRVAARMEATGEGLLLLVGDTGAGPLHSARADFALAVALRLARDCTGVDLKPMQVCFAHAAPDDATEYGRFFRTPVQFDSGANTMFLSAEDTDRPLRGADAALSAIIRRRLEKALAERNAPAASPLASRVRRLVVEDLGQTALTPETVAGMLGVSERTLSRHLAAEKTSFRRILDDTRCEFAMALLHDQVYLLGLEEAEPAPPVAAQNG